VGCERVPPYLMVDLGSISMSNDSPSTRLSCGCDVLAGRDFLGRGVGTIVNRGDECPRADHAVGHTVLLPGRDNAAPPDSRRLS
jgi:hypothetical protein